MNFTECVCRTKLHPARMSEWSKEPDLRPGSVNCVGSNPTSCKSDKTTLKVLIPTWSNG